MTSKLVPIHVTPNHEVIEASGVGNLLDRIRPEWKAKQLVQRVTKLLHADPSSACQRIFNASIHDLKEKIVIAGIDVAAEAAKQHKLPPVTRVEDIEDYSVLRTIELAYRIGLVTRPDYKKLLRSYDIRKDLEHEDDEYEAGVEDCVYIFSTCVDVVLSRDPVQLIKLTDIKSIIEQPSAVTLNEVVVEEYRHAPVPRQLEIYKFLVSTALDKKQPDIVQQNSYNALFALRACTPSQVVLEIGAELTLRAGKAAPELRLARVAIAAGAFPYLRKNQIKLLFQDYLEVMRTTGFSWRKFSSHGELLRNLLEIGGLDYCPDDSLASIVEWLVLCYIGEPGGYGAGQNRKVFYSNVGAPLALRLLKETKKPAGVLVSELGATSKVIKAAISDEHVARRFHSVLDEIKA